MARYSSKDVAFLLVGGYSLLGFQTELRWVVEALTERDDVLGDTWEEHSPVGVSRASLEQNGFYDDEADGNNAALVPGASTGPGQSRVLCIGVEGNTNRKKFTGFEGAVQANYERVASRGAFHKANASYVGSGVVEEGVILVPLATGSAASGTTDSVSHDAGASSANGGAVYAQMVALTLGGYTSFTVTLRHSADNVTFAAKATAIAATTAPTAVRTAFSGTLNRYTSIGSTFDGTGSGQSVTYMAGVYRAP